MYESLKKAIDENRTKDAIWILLDMVANGYDVEDFYSLIEN